MTRALLKQALEALQWEHGGEPLPTLTAAAINAIKAELDKPTIQQAPQVPMTDAEIWRSDAIMEVNADAQLPIEFIVKFVRAVEAHHNIKEQP